MEWWSFGVVGFGNGVVEWWSSGVMERQGPDGGLMDSWIVGLMAV